MNYLCSFSFARNFKLDNAPSLTRYVTTQINIEVSSSSIRTSVYQTKSWACHFLGVLKSVCFQVLSYTIHALFCWENIRHNEHPFAIGSLLLCLRQGQMWVKCDNTLKENERAFYCVSYLAPNHSPTVSAIHLSSKSLQWRSWEEDMAELRPHWCYMFRCIRSM